MSVSPSVQHNIVAYKSPLNSYTIKLFTLTKLTVMDTGTIMGVVRIIDSDIEALLKERELYLGSQEEWCKAQKFAIEHTVTRLENLSDYFQGYIEGQLNGMENSQGE